MTRSRQTTNNISNALRTIDSSLVPPDCTVEVYYDRLARTWYAQFLDLSGIQQGYMGNGWCPLTAVQDLMAMNRPTSSKTN